jgi:hypothetical protein
MLPDCGFDSGSIQTTLGQLFAATGMTDPAIRYAQ